MQCNIYIYIFTYYIYIHMYAYNCIHTYQLRATCDWPWIRSVGGWKPQAICNSKLIGGLPTRRNHTPGHWVTSPKVEYQPVDHPRLFSDTIIFIGYTDKEPVWWVWNTISIVAGNFSLFWFKYIESSSPFDKNILDPYFDCHITLSILVVGVKTCLLSIQ